MADALALFDSRRSKWTLPDGSLTREAQFFLRGLWTRLGGPIGEDNNAIQAIAEEALALARSNPLGVFGPRRDAYLSQEVDASQVVAQMAAFMPRITPTKATRANPNGTVSVTSDAASYVIGAVTDSDQAILAARVFAR